MESGVVGERRDHPTGEELELPDDLPVRRRHTARIVWVTAVAVAVVGAFQFLQAASDATDKPIGTFTRSIVPLAEPSASAFGASGELKLAFAMPAEEISYPLDVHGDPTALEYAWIRNGDSTLATAAQPLTGDKVTAPPTAGSTVPPSGVPTPSSTPPLAESNQLQNPGFETGTDPWRLVKANPNFNATITLDTTSAHSGKTSARIDITASDGLPQSISLQQAGVTLEQGANYRVSIALRSTADRQVRIRVTSPTPPFQTYGVSGPLIVGSAWTVQTFDSITAVGGTGRLFTIEVGQATGSVWIDDVSIARVSPFLP